MSYQTNFEPMVFLSFSMVFLWFPMVLRGPLRVPVSRQDSVATRQSTGHGSLGSGGRLDFPSIQKGGDGVGHGNSDDDDDDEYEYEYEYECEYECECECEYEYEYAVSGQLATNVTV
jgi:hypothetical protein